MMGTEAARIVIGVIGNIISIALFVSPLPVFIKILKNKSVEEYKSDPYLATTMNCIFWVLYGLPFVHPDSVLVVTINSIGLGIELIYLTIFFIYSDYQKRRWILGWLSAEVVFTVCIASAAFGGFHTHNSRSNFIGGFCVFFGILLYASPLTIIRTVLKTKSVEYMPLWLSCACFANGVIWTVYACLKFDAYIFAGNSVGTLLGAAQLALYWYYNDKTPKTLGGKPHKPTQEKPHKIAEVQQACA